jgi:hypothetical protein
MYEGANGEMCGWKMCELEYVQMIDEQVRRCEMVSFRVIVLIFKFAHLLICTLFNLDLFINV